MKRYKYIVASLIASAFLATGCSESFLEVSSPGIDRPLKKDKDFEAAYGTKVDIMFYTPWEGMKNLTGILVAHDDEAVQVKKIIKGKEFKNPDRIERRLIANIRPHIDF